MRLPIFLLLLLLGLSSYSGRACAQGIDSLASNPPVGNADTLSADMSPVGHLPVLSRRTGTSRRYNVAYLATPLLGGSLLMTLNDHELRNLRANHAPNFRHKYDDYIQFVPYALQIGLKSFGLKGGTSPDMGSMVVADAAAVALTSGIVLGIKHTARVLRPDGSTHNSFPSGHTATAFLGAQLLYHEYGYRHPLLGAIGYAIATATGVGRMLNNRHWASDVMAGAAIGIFSAEMGYLLSDLIFGRRPKIALFDGDWGLEGGVAHTISARTHHAFGALSYNPDEGVRTDLSTTYRIGIGYNYRFAKGWCLGAELFAGQRRFFVGPANAPKQFAGIIRTMGIAIEAGYRWQLYSFLHIEPKVIGDYMFASTAKIETQDYNYRLHRAGAPGIGTRLSFGWHINKRMGIDTFGAVRLARPAYSYPSVPKSVYQTDFQPEIGLAFVLSL